MVAADCRETCIRGPGVRHDQIGSIPGGLLIAATCATPPVLVGRVVGGAIAAYFAAAHLDRLTHLVLVDTMGFEAFQPDPRFGLAMHRFLAEPSISTYERFMDFCAFDLDTPGPVRSALDAGVQ